MRDSSLEREPSSRKRENATTFVVAFSLFRSEGKISHCILFIWIHCFFQHDVRFVTFLSILFGLFEEGFSRIRESPL